jgi:exodeoxyribonuclease-3
VLPQVLDWLAAQPSVPVDVLALQELKLTDDKFPAMAFQEAGYAGPVVRPEDLQRRGPDQPAAGLRRGEEHPRLCGRQARVIAATVAGVRVIGAYFPNGQAPGSDKFAYKMRWLDALRAWVRAELAAHPKLVLMGDYNIAPDDRDVYDPVGLAGRSTAPPKSAPTSRP